MNEFFGNIDLKGNSHSFLQSISLKCIHVFFNRFMNFHSIDYKEKVSLIKYSTLPQSLTMPHLMKEWVCIIYTKYVNDIIKRQNAQKNHYIKTFCKHTHLLSLTTKFNINLSRVLRIVFIKYYMVGFFSFYTKRCPNALIAI